MKFLCLPACLLLLTGCSQLEPSLVWLEPTPRSVVVGTVELSVQAVGETPANVVFSLGEQSIAKAYAEDEGRYSAVWDSSSVAAGRYTLFAKPYGGVAISTSVTVAEFSE